MVKVNVFLSMALAVAVSAYSCGTLTHYTYTKWDPKVTCTKPIEINGELAFPCGKCLACKIQRTQEWAIRLMDESSYWENSIFVTLTYSDQSIPDPPLIDKSELQRFLKRLRKSYPTKIKYYASGEYGEKFGRPHYHLIIFGMKISDKKIIEENWKLGRVHVGTVTIDSCRYVASYIQKKTKNNNTVFSLSSQGLGLDWAEDNHKYLSDNERITHQGVPMGIPRYYVKKLGLDLSKTQNKREEEVSKKISKRQNKNNDSDIFDTNLLSKVQKDRNITAKTSLKEKIL